MLQFRDVLNIVRSRYRSKDTEFGTMFLREPRLPKNNRIRFDSPSHPRLLFPPSSMKGEPPRGLLNRGTQQKHCTGSARHHGFCAQFGGRGAVTEGGAARELGHGVRKHHPLPPRASIIKQLVCMLRQPVNIKHDGGRPRRARRSPYSTACQPNYHPPCHSLDAPLCNVQGKAANVSFYCFFIVFYCFGWVLVVVVGRGACSCRWQRFGRSA